MTLLTPDNAPKECDLHPVHEINCVKCIAYRKTLEIRELFMPLWRDVRRQLAEREANREKQSG